MNVSVILPAAGLGTRMGREKSGTSRKQFMLLEGSPILVHTVRKFVASPLVTDIVVAVRVEEIDWVEEMLQKEGANLNSVTPLSSDELAQSLREALKH